MLEFIAGVAVGVVGFFVVMKIVVQLALRRIERELTALKEHTESDIVDAKLEFHHNTYYVFRADNDAFLAQGQTMSELRQALNNSIKHTRIRVVEGDDDVIAQLKSTS